MPRPDGTLYNFERDATKATTKPAKPKKAPEAKAVRIVDRTVKAPDIYPAHPLAPQPARFGKAGRPYAVKITPEKVEAVLSDIKGGLSVESALVLAGLTRTGIDRWLKANAALKQRFEAAEVAFEKSMVGCIVNKAPSDHKAASWLLERRMPQGWAQTSKTELTGKNGGAVQVHSLSAQLLASVGGEMKQAVPA